MTGIANFAKESVSAGGTGNLTVGGAIAGHISLNTAVGIKRYFTYVIKDGSDYEVGYGYLSASTTLVRSKILQTVVSGVVDYTSPSALNVSTSAEVGIDKAAQAIMGGHSGFFLETSGVQGLSNFAEVHATGAAGGGFNNLLSMDPFFLPASCYITKLMLHVVGTAASGVLRVGLWSKAPNGLPGELMLDFTSGGTIDCSSSSAKSATDATGTWAPSGDYYIGGVGNSASITIKSPQYSPNSTDLGMTSAGSAVLSLYRAFTYGALPTTDQSVETWSTNTVRHSYWLS